MLLELTFSWKAAHQKQRSEILNYVWLDKISVSKGRTVKGKKLVPMGPHCFYII